MYNKISICIPTYNNGRYLNECMNSFIQLKNYIFEILVGDSNSNDNTKDIILELSKKYNFIKYINLKKKQGIDRDLLKLTSYAKGDYIWFFSADDSLKSNIQELFSKILYQKADLFIFNRIEYDIKLENKLNNKCILDGKSDILININSKNDLQNYFNSINSFVCMFSYIPSIMIKKKIWDIEFASSKYLGTNYFHSFKIFDYILKNAISVFISRKKIIKTRFGNDSFNDGSFFKRINIDFLWCNELIKYFNDDSISLRIRNIVRNEHKILNLFKFLILEKKKDNWLITKSYLEIFRYPKVFIFILSIFSYIKFNENIN